MDIKGGSFFSGISRMVETRENKIIRLLGQDTLTKDEYIEINNKGNNDNKDELKDNFMETTNGYIKKKYDYTLDELNSLIIDEATKAKYLLKNKGTYTTPNRLEAIQEAKQFLKDEEVKYSLLTNAYSKQKNYKNIFDSSTKIEKFKSMLKNLYPFMIKNTGKIFK